MAVSQQLVPQGTNIVSTAGRDGLGGLGGSLSYRRCALSYVIGCVTRACRACNRMYVLSCDWACNRM